MEGKIDGNTIVGVGGPSIVCCIQVGDVLVLMIILGRILGGKG